MVALTTGTGGTTAEDAGREDGAPPTDDEALAFALQVWQYKQGELVSLLIHLGDRLGLYRAMRGRGPMTPADLAAATGLQERWVAEWLRGQGAAHLVTICGGDRFELSEAGAAVLADEESSLLFAAGAFGPQTDETFVDDLAEAFRTGIGLPYDRQGPSGAHRTERMLGPWARIALVPRILPALDGVAAKLAAAATVADVGCGAGVALTAMASAFPASVFHGYDISRHAIDRATEKVTQAGLDNVTLHLSGADALPTEATFDLVVTFDCLHDMTAPQSAIAAIRRAIREDGTWLVKEIRCAPDLEGNLANPMAALMYGLSVTGCMSSALSEPGGAGLGTLGLHPELLRDLADAAGFSRFTMHDFDDPANLYYEIRP